MARGKKKQVGGLDSVLIVPIVIGSMIGTALAVVTTLICGVCIVDCCRSTCIPATSEIINSLRRIVSDLTTISRSRNLVAPAPAPSTLVQMTAPYH
jgi:hypothetical protein